MPTYEYRCRACGHTFEIVQKMSEDALTICPECGGELRKVFAPPAITFKGSGFYATDHGKKTKTSTSAGGEGGDKKSTDTTAEKKGAEKKGADAPPASSAKDGGAST